MWRLRRFVLRLMNVGRRGRAEEALAREIASHLAALEDEFQRRGMSPEEARVAAKRAFGGVEQAKEHQRDARSFRWLDDGRRDLGYALRMLRRTPGFALVAVLTLALGIGANTAIFSLIDAVLLRTLPVEAPERLVVLDIITQRGETNSISYPLFEWLRDEPGAFSGVLAALDGFNRVDLTGPEAASQAEEVRLQLVSGEYFSVLGVPAAAGRIFTRGDDGNSAAPPVAVLSFDFWKRRFAADSAVIGRNVTLKNQPFTVVGVAAPGFFGEAVGRAPDIWVPLTWQPRLDRGRSLLDRPNVGWLRVMGRLRPGMTREQAGAALDLAQARLRAEPTHLGKSSGHVATIRASDGSRGLSQFRDSFSLPLRILAAVVGIVLLIACANVSCLLLARATARQREVAVRLAIGAGRLRLIRQFLAESVLLASVGGALGLLVAWWGSRALLVLASSEPTPIPIEVTPNVRTLAFTTAVSLAAVVVFGLAPALAASRVDVGASLKLATAGRNRWRLSPFLLVAQVALSLLLLMGAGLMVQTLRNLRALDLGFVADTVIQVRIVPESSGYSTEQVPELSRRLTERLSSIPGVESVTLAHSGFGGGISRTCCIAVEGYTPNAAEDRRIRTNNVAPGYFRTMRLPLILGRDFTAQDLPSRAPKVAIVNEAFARRYFADERPIGKRFGWGNPPKVSYDTEIVGVARNAIYNDLREDPKPFIYFPTSEARFLMVRAAGAPSGLVGTIRREISALERNLQFGIRPVSEDLDRALVHEKLLAKLSSFFGALAVILAALGLYGVVAYAVAGRTREIGIRMAIGARRAAVLWAELRSAMRLVMIGLAVGLPAALTAGRLIENQLFGVSAAEPAVLAVAIALLTVVSLAAAYVPARRASRVDPMVALRDQ